MVGCFSGADHGSALRLVQRRPLVHGDVVGPVALDLVLRIEDLMTRQGELHDALESAIADLEELAETLKPPPPEE